MSKVCAALVRIIPHPCAAAWTAARHGLGQRWRALLAGIGSDCPLCGGAARGGLLCEPCARAALKQAVARRCPRCAVRVGATQAGKHGGLCVDCALHPPAFVRTVTAFDYADPYDALMRRYKGARRHVVANAMAQSLARAVQAVAAARANEAAPVEIAGPGTGRPLVDAVIPVPASRASLRQRGFNPAGELARALSQRLALRLSRGILRRRRESVARQASLMRSEREVAALGAYVCVRRLDGLRIALVDDVMTTGSTADAAARALLAAGATSVTVWVAARTPALR